MQTLLCRIGAQLSLLREEVQAFRSSALEQLRDVRSQIQCASGQPAKTPRPLTTAEACEFLRCSRWTLRKFCREGQIRPKRVGRQLRYSLRELERFLDRSPPRKNRAGE